MKYFGLILAIVLYSGSLWAQKLTEEEEWQQQFSKVSFLITHASKDYDSSLLFAQQISRDLKLDLELNGNYPDENSGLNCSDTCGCGVSHGYIARGRFDAGDYVSIEYSNAYTEFTKGYYIVVISSGDIEKVQLMLKSIQEKYPTAYINDASIYMGCMH